MWCVVAVTGAGLAVATALYLALLGAWAVVRQKPTFALRHAVCAAAMWALFGIFWAVREGGEGVHRWNRAFADASLLLYAVTLALGPMARIWRPARRALVWRRETGLWATYAAIVHVAFYLDWVYRWDWRYFFYAFHRTDGGFVLTGELSRRSVEIANWLGLFALAYALLLALTSNDLSQRILGRGWRWLQARATTMWVLVLVHTWLFAYLVYAGNRVVAPLVWVCFGAVLLLQCAAFFVTRSGGRMQAVADE